MNFTLMEKLSANYNKSRDWDTNITPSDISRVKHGRGKTIEPIFNKNTFYDT